MSKPHFHGLSRSWKLIIAGASVIILAVALVLIFSFSFTVRNILPKNMKVTAMELHGLECCGYSEFHTELTEYENLLSVLRYVESIPLQPLAREPADAKEWSITIYTLDHSSYEVRFIGNEAVSFGGQLYSVKATPFFRKGTDIYNNVCKLAGDDAFSFDHASIAAGLVDVFESEDGVYCLKDIGNIHLSDELDSYTSLYGLYLLNPENETGEFVCRIPGDHTAYYDGSVYYTDGYDRHSIMAYDLSSEKYRTVLTWPEGDIVYVSYISDGHMAFNADWRDERGWFLSNKLYVMDMENGQVTPLPTSAEKSIFNFIGYDGDALIYIDQEDSADVMYSQKIEDQYPAVLAAGPEGSFSGACLLLDGVYYYPGEDSLLESFEINDSDSIQKHGVKPDYGNVEHIAAYDGDIYVLWCYERQEYAVFKLDNSGTISKLAESDEMDYLALGFYATQKGIIIKWFYTYTWIPFE